MDGMHGWCSNEKAQKLMDICLLPNTKKVLEIGLFAGKSFFPMVAALKYSGKKDVEAFGVDPWDKWACVDGKNDPESDEWWSKLDLDSIHEYFWKKAREFDVMQIEEPIMRVFRTTSSGFHKTHGELFPQKTFDLIHIDGNHSEERSVEDISLWLPKLANGGYLVFDDVDWATTGKAYAALQSEFGDPEVIINNCAFFVKGA